ncbi:conserved hypothetical protein [Paraburkholderia tropica]|uniref:ATP-binding protein n=1 Tax=Paraburkholderia tropica TaxID=92647 RepID=UPI001CB1D02E|nr:hypothetical protein [Paraburkholderia tropica]CAG9237748.1 conserved hypothetical protein [Paraburkholderia tropica]
MSEAVTERGATRRNFKVHPAIIKTLIGEQAGTLPKAFAELVMNSVDAGSTRIDLDIDEAGRFTFWDNGRGFTSSVEIEEFFDTFGTPHVPGDAYFARFRCGRGQIMSYARTIWRSGHYEMRVDLNGEEGEAGYDFEEHAECHPGCSITGQIYEFANPYFPKNHSLRVYFTGEDDSVVAGRTSEFACLVRYVLIPVFVNGRQINTPPIGERWDQEDEHAYYAFDRDSPEVRVFNRGVLVTDIPSRKFGIGGVVCSKAPLVVNMARNAVIEHQCETWQAITKAISERFRFQLTRLRKLNDHEAASLLRRLFFSDFVLDHQDARTVAKIRFLPDIFGNLRSPDAVLFARKFTLFDGVHTAIAERVQREGLAQVIMPRMLSMCNATVTEENAAVAIGRLRSRLRICDDQSTELVRFEEFVRSLDGTYTLVDSADLDAEETLVLKCLTLIGREIALLSGASSVRRFVVGISDTASAWTDGCTFIALNRAELKRIRGDGNAVHSGGGGVARLVAIITHEYCHGDSSVGDHHHDYDFMSRFHEAILHPAYGAAVDLAFRRYVAGICRLGVVPSSAHGAHLRGLFKYAQRVPTRIKRPADTGSLHGVDQPTTADTCGDDIGNHVGYAR